MSDQMTEMNKCPNCDGKMERVRGTLYRCPFCNSEFEFGEDGKETGKSKKPAVTPGKEFSKTDRFDFQVTYKELVKGSDTKKIMESFVYCINELESSEEILKHIHKLAVKCRGIGLEGYHDEYLESFAKRMKKVLDPDEKPLIYINTAVFSSGKHGFMITDKRTVTEGKKTNQLPHEELRSIRFDMDDDTPFIYLNCLKDLKLTRISDVERPLGAVIALICAFSFEMAPKHDRIMIVGPESDDDYEEDEELEEEEFEEEDEEEEDEEV